MYCGKLYLCETIKPNTMNTILKARSIGDSELFFTVTLVKRNEVSAWVILDNNVESRFKIKRTFDGREFIMPYGTYSMAPAFYLA